MQFSNKKQIDKFAKISLNFVCFANKTDKQSRQSFGILTGDCIKFRNWENAIFPIWRHSKGHFFLVSIFFDTFIIWKRKFGAKEWPFLGMKLAQLYERMVNCGSGQFSLRIALSFTQFSHKRFLVIHMQISNIMNERILTLVAQCY